jgi:large conductance mechanosensitive channel
MWKELKAFLLRGNVVDLAVGVVIGAAFTGIVNALVNNIINPFIALVTPASSLATAGIELRAAVMDAAGAVTTPAVVLGWGALLAAIINFVIVGIVLFFIIKGVNRMMPPPPPPPPAGPSIDEQMLAELKKLNSK